MEPSQERPYVDPAMPPGDQGTEPWADGDTPDTKPDAVEESPADAFTDGHSTGLDYGSADPESDTDAG